MDAFKKHFNEHLNKIREDEPQERVWQNIKQQVVLPKPNVIRMTIKWAIAACVIGLLGIGLYIFNTVSEKGLTLHSSNKEQHQVKRLINDIDSHKKNNLPSLAVKKIIQDNNSHFLVVTHTKLSLKAKGLKQKAFTTQNQLALTDIEKSFDEVINLQKERVNNTPLNAESPAYFTEFSNEVKAIDRDEATIKKEIKKHGIKPELLDELINIYQQKLNVLKQLQHEMQKTNNRYKQGRVPTDTTKRYFLNI